MTPLLDDGSFGRDDMIVLRLTRPTAVDVEDLATTKGPLARFVSSHQLASRRAITSVPATRVLAWEAEARHGPFPPLHSLTAVNDPMYVALNQGYLAAAPVGVDAEWAWRLRPSRDGSGVRFVDVELGWQSPHEDVSLPPLVGGVNNVNGTTLAYHGLGVLGIVSALTNNARGIAATAPGAAAGWIASANYGGVVNVVDALTAVRGVASAGDVVLLELQTVDELPVESLSLERDAIRLTVSAGIVVVEAAGNAGVNLATVPGIDPAVDSGAILVAAGGSAAPHARATSNWGARIDCYAWGDSVYTTGGFGTSVAVPDPGQSAVNRYTRDFAATSAAAAIVAGAALIVQGAYKASTLGRRSPADLRSLLRANGTAGGGGGATGLMPDIRQLLPDIYIRDNLADAGNVPTAGAVSVSPDVIVTTAAVANPQATYGAGSPNENVDTLGELVRFGQTNYVYVRMKNRGTGVAAGCTATVYWSDVGTLITPSSWHLIGTTSPVDVGPALTVTDPLLWNTVPATGHYCFVATIDHPLDPAPSAPVGSWDDFVDYVRNNNNVTWRNFDVVDVSTRAPGIAPFKIMGAPDSQRTFDFEIVRDPVDQAVIDFEIPLALMRRLPAGALPRPTIDDGQKIARYRLPRKRVVALQGVTLPARAAFACRFVIRTAAPPDGRLPTVAVRQLFKRLEVGRVTWAYRFRRG
jgi:serine protease